MYKHMSGGHVSGRTEAVGKCFVRLAILPSYRLTSLQSTAHHLPKSHLVASNKQSTASMVRRSSSEAVRNSVFEIEKPVFPHAGDAEHMAMDDKRATDQHIPIYNELEFVSETDLSFNSILKGTAANPLTNFEKKAALVNL